MGDPSPLTLIRKCGVYGIYIYIRVRGRDPERIIAVASDDREARTNGGTAKTEAYTHPPKYATCIAKEQRRWLPRSIGTAY